MLLKENAIRKEKLVNGKNRYYLFIFPCLICGKELKIQGSSLHRHSGKCMRCTQLKSRPYEHIYNELKAHKKYGMSVTISFEEFLEIIKDRKCHYCGEELIFHENSRFWGNTNSRAHQLDRKDNNLGYTKDNIVCSCWDCNRLKSDRYTYEEFIQLSPVLKKIREDRKAS